MKLFGRNIAGFAKVVVILVGVLLVASGLCGLQFLITQGGAGKLDSVMMAVGVLELIAILLSLTALIVVLPLWGVVALVRRTTGSPKRDNGSQPSSEGGDGP